MSITFTTHCEERILFGWGQPGCCNSYDWRFTFGSYVRAQVSSIATIHLKKIRHLPFGTGPSRPVRLHSGAIVAPQQFHGVSNTLQVCGNSECRAECGAQFYDILRLSLLTNVQSIVDRPPTGKQGVELCCSPRGVVLYRGCPEWHPCLPETF